MIILQLENLMHRKYLQYKIALNIKFKKTSILSNLQHVGELVHILILFLL